MGKDSAAAARRCALVCASVMFIITACGDLQQASETSDTEVGMDSSSAGDGVGMTAPGADTGLPTADDSGDATEGGGSDTGPPGDTTAAPGPACGDGHVDVGEVCDDGNDDETDDCTSLCALPSCDDGIQSGAETGIDCGASCDGCILGDGCSAAGDCRGGLVCDASSACAWPASCLQLFEAWPETKSGGWPLDPDGDGQSENFACDMTPGDAGWTRVLSEDFDSSDGAAWSEDVAITTCGSLGMILGGYDELSGDKIARDVDLFGIAHGEARLRGGFVKIDSWDFEDATAQIDADVVWTATYDNGSGGPTQCGTIYNDGLFDVDGQVAHASETMSISFGTNLSADPNDESWGISQVEVWIR